MYTLTFIRSNDKLNYPPTEVQISEEDIIWHITSAGMCAAYETKTLLLFLLNKWNASDCYGWKYWIPVKDNDKKI